MDSYDKEVEKALIKGYDVEEYLRSLTSEHPSELAKKALQESRAIEHVCAVAQERKAYALVQQAEAHLKACNEHWEAATTRVHETAPEN